MMRMRHHLGATASAFMASRHAWLILVTLWPLVAAADVPAERQAELRHLLVHDCGSCHGLRLTGGLGPPLTPLTLAGKESPALAGIIRQGLPGTPMPPWKAMLSDEEARWLADYLKHSPGKHSPGKDSAGKRPADGGSATR